MSKRNKQNNCRARKRKWNGVVPSKEKQCDQKSDDVPVCCSSSRKLNVSVCPKDDSMDDYFMLMHFQVLKNIVAHGICKGCLTGTLSITDKLNVRMGFCHSLWLTCSDCPFSQQFYTSPKSKNVIATKKVRTKTDKEKKKRTDITVSPYEVNLRAVIALREIGSGHESMKLFSFCMNLQCMSDKGFNRIQRSAHLAYKNAAKKSMTKAADEAKSVGDSQADLKQTRVSIDGSWQKRGHTSLNGIVTAVSGDKCVDIEILTKHCFGCRMWKDKKGTPEYQCWLVDHQCEINHETSSGSMEASGAVKIFQRSIQNNKLIYKEYLGDGDTSSFLDVVNSDPYKEQGIVPVKLECVGHVQKRLGTRLRNLVKAHKGTNQPLAGRGKLTEKVINSMQNFYGLAIRSNTGNLYAMRKAVYAILFHFTDTPNLATRHMFCPREQNSWCKYWALDKKDYKSKCSIPVWIKELLLPIIKHLQSNELLSKCLHGETQNANEALNGVIWTRIPKRVFVGRTTLEIGAYSSVLAYNDGTEGILEVLNAFGLRGTISEISATTLNKDRVKQMKRKSSDEGKKRRKKLRSIKKGYLDDEKLKDSYNAGGF